MPDTLPIPDDLPEKDRQRVEHVNRNIRIRREYDRLRPKVGWQRARQKLAERYSISMSTVAKVVKGQR